MSNYCKTNLNILILDGRSLKRRKKN